jgi:glycosyltransferase involved in cell wall biosynthesis
MREAHRALVPRCACAGFDVVPVNTREPRQVQVLDRDPYLASDPLVIREPVRVDDVDALLLMDVNPGVDFTAVRRRRQRERMPVFAVVHDLLPISNPEWFPPQAGLHFRVLLQQIIWVSDHIVVCTDATRHALIDLKWQMSADVHVIPLGTVAHAARAPRAMDDGLRLLYVSTIEPRKGHARLLDAVEILRSESVPVDVTFVGRLGWQMEHFADRLRSHPGRGDWVHWDRGADDARMRELLASSDVAVMPSSGEGYGLFIDDALASGLMVVATDIPEFRERQHPNLILTSVEPTDLAAAIRRAAATTPQPVSPGDIRPIASFGTELTDLVLDVLA